MNEKEKEQLIAQVSSFHKVQINKAIDECTNKNLDFESAKLLKEMFDVSMDQIVGSFIIVIDKLKKQVEEKVA